MKFSFAFIRAVEIHCPCGTTFKGKHSLEDLLFFQAMDDNFEITFLI